MSARALQQVGVGLDRTRLLSALLSLSQSGPPPPLLPPLTPDIEAAHELACSRGAATYTDSASGYSVFTSRAHRERGYCCGSACRHCPFGNCRVKSARKRRLDRTALLRFEAAAPRRRDSAALWLPSMRSPPLALLAWLEARCAAVEVGPPSAAACDDDDETSEDEAPAAESALLLLATYDPVSYSLLPAPHSAAEAVLALSAAMDFSRACRIDLFAVAVEGRGEDRASGGGGGGGGDAGAAASDAAASVSASMSLFGAVSSALLSELGYRASLRIVGGAASEATSSVSGGSGSVESKMSESSDELPVFAFPLER